MKDWLREYLATAADGVSSAVPPEALQATQLAWARNVSTRGGFAHTRPALDQLGFLPAGKFQGISYCSKHGGILVASIAGRLYRIALGGFRTFTTSSIPIEFNNSATLPRVYFCETPSALIVQDDQSAPIIYDGASARRAKRKKNEIPVGSFMAYASGRLWLCVNGIYLLAGDIYTGDGTELLFTETNFFTGGGSRSFPAGISGLAFIPKVDSTAGFGPLFVFSPSTTDSIHAEITARDTWQTVDGFQTQVFGAVGALGQIAAVNQDLFWRDGDGAIRSLRQVVADLAGPGSAPISREVSRVIDSDSPDLLDASSTIYFDNRLLTTAAPRYDGVGGVVFDRIVSLDFSTIATMRGKYPPAYDGEWMAPGVRQLVSGKFQGKNRAFAVIADASGRNILAEISADAISDTRLISTISAPTSVAKSIPSSIESRAYSFGDPNKVKRLERLDMFISQIRGEVSVVVYFRADNAEEWTEWDSFNLKAAVTDSSRSAPHKWKRLAPGSALPIKTLTIPDDVKNGKMPHVGCLLQIRLEWIGSCRIDRLRLFASNATETQYAGRDDGATEQATAEAYVDQDGTPYVDSAANPYVQIP